LDGVAAVAVDLRVEGVMLDRDDETLTAEGVDALLFVDVT
jgi:hypothetical protein